MLVILVLSVKRIMLTQNDHRRSHIAVDSAFFYESGGSAFESQLFHFFLHIYSELCFELCAMGRVIVY